MNQPGGTAYGSRVAGLDMCGKTGSVQVVGQKEAKKGHLLPEQLRDHGWFVGFAPKDDPQIVVASSPSTGSTARAPPRRSPRRCAAYWVTKRRGRPAARRRAGGAPLPPGGAR